jgi:hypothetical protein
MNWTQTELSSFTLGKNDIYLLTIYLPGKKCVTFETWTEFLYVSIKRNKNIIHTICL